MEEPKIENPNYSDYIFNKIPGNILEELARVNIPKEKLRNLLRPNFNSEILLTDRISRETALTDESAVRLSQYILAFDAMPPTEEQEKKRNWNEDDLHLEMRASSAIESDTKNSSF